MPLTIEQLVTSLAAISKLRKDAEELRQLIQSNTVKLPQKTQSDSPKFVKLTFADLQASKMLRKGASARLLGPVKRFEDSADAVKNMAALPIQERIERREHIIAHLDKITEDMDVLTKLYEQYIKQYLKNNPSLSNEYTAIKLRLKYSEQIGWDKNNPDKNDLQKKWDANFKMLMADGRYPFKKKLDMLLDHAIMLSHLQQVLSNENPDKNSPSYQKALEMQDVYLKRPNSWELNFNAGLDQLVKAEKTEQLIALAKECSGKATVFLMEFSDALDATGGIIKSGQEVYAIYKPYVAGKRTKPMTALLVEANAFQKRLEEDVNNLTTNDYVQLLVLSAEIYSNMKHEKSESTSRAKMDQVTIDKKAAEFYALVITPAIELCKDAIRNNSLSLKTLNEKLSAGVINPQELGLLLENFQNTQQKTSNKTPPPPPLSRNQLVAAAMERANKLAEKQPLNNNPSSKPQTGPSLANTTGRERQGVTGKDWDKIAQGANTITQETKKKAFPLQANVEQSTNNTIQSTETAPTSFSHKPR